MRFHGTPDTQTCGRGGNNGLQGQNVLADCARPVFETKQSETAGPIVADKGIHDARIMQPACRHAYIQLVSSVFESCENVHYLVTECSLELARHIVRLIGAQRQCLESRHLLKQLTNIKMRRAVIVPVRWQHKALDVPKSKLHQLALIVRCAKQGQIQLSKRLWPRAGPETLA